MKRQRSQARIAMSMRVRSSLTCLAVGFLLASPAGATFFLDTVGFEDDVDLVVHTIMDPVAGLESEFLVIPEENESGSEAFLTIVDLDSVTGAPLGVSARIPVMGFEDGVDPLITRCTEDAPPLVLVPLEEEDAPMAQILILEVDPATGALISPEVWIDLGILGFHPDVDGTWPSHAAADGTDCAAFFALESEDGGARGVIAIDVNNDGGAAFGACWLLSTLPWPVACGVDYMTVVDWLPGLTSAMDPVSYSLGDFFSRLILPVSSGDAVSNDVLLIDFNPNEGADQPLFTSYTSVKGTNAGSALPTPFPGFEDGVDMVHLTYMCMEENKLLVPVEGPGDEGDLYLLNLDEGFDGEAVWVYSIDGDPDVPIPGYKEGVDVLPLCDLGGAVPHRVAVPVENEAGTDADLLIVNLETGELFGHAEDQVLNPGFTFPGYEIGIEPLRWDDEHVVVPAELDGFARIYSFTLNADRGAWAFSNSYGYVRSVDPIVVSGPGGPTIFTPVAKPDGSDADVWVSSPPFPAFSSLEDINAGIGLTISGFEWDVDLGAVPAVVLYHLYMYLPEENADGTAARVRFQEILSDVDETKLVVATQEVGADPASLLFFHPDGEFDLGYDDVLGLEPGLDMAGRPGPLHAANPPTGLIPGQDADTDPTLLWLLEPTSVGSEQAANMALPWGVQHPNPFSPRGQLSFTLPEAGVIEVEVFDVTGRLVRRLFHGREEAGKHSLAWDGRDGVGHALASGTYFLRIRSSAGGAAVTKLVLLR